MPGRTPRPGDAGRLLGALEEHLHADADAEERHAPARPRRARAASSPVRRSASMQRPKAPDPGQHDAGRVADQAGVGGEPGVGADVLQRLLGRAQVADP